MEDLILALNPLFGNQLLGVATQPLRKQFERIGPDHYDDANCNKIIFAVLAMTLFRALLGNAIAFAFDCWRTCNIFWDRPVMRMRHLVEHCLALIGGCALTYGVFRAAVEAMEALRAQPKIFSAERPL